MGEWWKVVPGKQGEVLADLPGGGGQGSEGQGLAGLANEQSGLQGHLFLNQVHNGNVQHHQTQFIPGPGGPGSRY